MLSNRVNNIKESGIRKVFELAVKNKGEYVNLSIGQPDFNVPDELKQSAVKAIRNNENNYAPTQGILPLREKIAEKLKNENQINSLADDIIITSGVSGGIFLLLASIVDPGDEVIITEPYFVMYKELLDFFQAKIIYLDTYPDFHIKPEKLKKLITKKTKALIINTPGNPTGAIFGRNELSQIAEICKKYNTLVISDEIYEKFDYECKFSSIGSIYNKTVTLNGFSKSQAITGWRVGYAHGPNEIIHAMNKLQQYTFVCAPTFAQHALAETFNPDISKEIEGYGKKRDYLFDGLKASFKLNKPEGAFYAFIKCPDGRKNFVEDCIKNKLLVVPSTSFSRRDDHFRVSFAVTGRELDKGVEILKALGQDSRGWHS